MSIPENSLQATPSIKETAIGKQPTVTAVIPTLNEAKNLPHVLPFLPEMVTEVIIVDGRSTDDTIEVAKRLRPDVKIVLETAKGKGAALRAGFAASTGDIIVMLDADGSTDPTEIPAFVGALTAGADFVKGSRFMQGGLTDDMEFHRYLGNLGLTWTVRLLFGGGYSDLCYGYAAFWRRVLPDLRLASTGFEIETEMNIRALRAKLNISEVGSREKPRVYGTSNLNAIRDGIRIAKLITREYVDQVRTWFVRDEKRIQMSTSSFSNAVQLLLTEGVRLKERENELPPEVYQSKVAVLRESLAKLLVAPVDNPTDRFEQTRLRMLGTDVWRFLDETTS